MTLRYSVAFDIRPVRGNAPRTLRELFVISVDALLTMRIRKQLPDRSALEALWEKNTVDVNGSGNLQLSWAADEVSSTEPDSAWAIRVEHESADDPRQLWTLELHARRSTSRIQFGTRLDLTILAGSGRPLDISPTRPIIVPRLITTFDCQRNGLPLSSDFLPKERLPRLGSLLTAPERELPVLLASSMATAERLKRVADQNAGLAVLGYLADDAAKARFNLTLDSSFRFPEDCELCVYWPIDIGMSQQALGSRREPISLVPGVARVAKDLLEKLANVGNYSDPGSFTSVDRIRRQHEVRIAQSSRETLVKQEKDNEELLKDLLQKDVEIGELRRSAEDLHQAVRDGRKTYGKLYAELERTRAEKPNATVGRDRFAGWRVDSVATALLIARIAPAMDSRMAVSGRAIKTAEESNYKKPAEVLEALAFLGFEFLDKKRAGDAGDLEGFAATSGFQVALTETGYTKSNAEWMKERRVVMQGRTFECIPHLKLGKEFRIYFCFDDEVNPPVLVIGPIGEHLTTRQTGMQ